MVLARVVYLCFWQYVRFWTCGRRDERYLRAESRVCLGFMRVRERIPFVVRNVILLVVLSLLCRAFVDKRDCGAAGLDPRDRWGVQRAAVPLALTRRTARIDTRAQGRACSRRSG